MEKTIDEHMAQLKMLRSYNMIYRSYGASINYALDIISKYQKIQEIINNAKDSDGAVKYNWLYEQIGEVVKDGNDNN